MRQIVLDTETTGLEPENGHRIIEIGCVEIVNRRLTGNHFHQYLQPDREIDPAAAEVHGITEEFLRDKPRFGDIAADFLAFVRGAELIIHNAAFDTGFINHELRLWDAAQLPLESLCTVTDTLGMARRLHPGQKNNLDALCKRYSIDNSQRTLHGALLDAEILADVYLSMTGGQADLTLDTGEEIAIQTLGNVEIRVNRANLIVIRADGAELDAHMRVLEILRKAGKGKCAWDSFEESAETQGIS
ncbi:MAG TPA: DNA polymerase III subunit epsilon [Gammaproteobacteria bacterium]|nr:DNA polymerase III subunit epsilon [Gammaproteobacteria bacterium]